MNKLTFLLIKEFAKPALAGVLTIFLALNSGAQNLSENTHGLLALNSGSESDVSKINQSEIVKTNTSSFIIDASSFESCDGGRIDLDAIAPEFLSAKDVTYKWSTNSGTLLNVNGAQATLVVGNKNAVVTLYATANGITYEKSIVIKSNAVSASFKSSEMVIGNQSLLLKPSIEGNTAGCQFSWNILNESSPSLNTSNPGTYSLTVVNEKGCKATASVMVVSAATGSESDFTHVY